MVKRGASTMNSLFQDLAFIFIAATAAGFLAWLVNLPLILGFVLGGIIISPFTPGLHVSHVEVFHEAAEAGVVLLMFSIGVEFSVSDLMRVKWVALVGGSLGIGPARRQLRSAFRSFWDGRSFRAWSSARPFPSPAPWSSPASWWIAAR